MLNELLLVRMVDSELALVEPLPDDAAGRDVICVLKLIGMHGNVTSSQLNLIILAPAVHSNGSLNQSNLFDF